MNHLKLRLKEAKATLETLEDQCTLTRADLWAAELEYTRAVDEAKILVAQEIKQAEKDEQDYKVALKTWQFRQSREATTSLQRKKTWQHQLLVLIACLFSGGLFLILEVREIWALQSQRDNPRQGDEQRTWTRNRESARRKIEYLRSLQGPRPTPEMRERQQEVFSLRKKRDMLEHQILLQETRIEVLQQELTSSSSV